MTGNEVVSEALVLFGEREALVLPSRKREILLGHGRVEARRALRQKLVTPPEGLHKDAVRFWRLCKGRSKKKSASPEQMPLSGYEWVNGILTKLLWKSLGGRRYFLKIVRHLLCQGFSYLDFVQMFDLCDFEGFLSKQEGAAGRGDPKEAYGDETVQWYAVLLERLRCKPLDKSRP